MFLLCVDAVFRAVQKVAILCVHFEGVLLFRIIRYKNLDEVMENQKTLVNVRFRLRPVLNVKGV